MLFKHRSNKVQSGKTDWLKEPFMCKNNKVEKERSCLIWELKAEMKGAAPVKVQNRRSFLFALTAKETHIQKNIASGGQMQFVEIVSNQGTSQRSVSLKILTQNLNKLT